MKLGYFRKKGDTDSGFSGVIEGNIVVDVRKVLQEGEAQTYNLDDLNILSPVMPTKIIGVGLNYRKHALELGMKIPDEPVLFFKPLSAILNPNGVIRLPLQSNQVEYEAELAVVIKRTCYRISPDEVEKVLLGYTSFNDVTARDLQKKDGQWARAKGFNTFAPFGPFVETELNPNALNIECLVNNEVKQSSNTQDMIFNVQELVTYISSVMTLYPGDIITTGTPHGIGALKKGDSVIVRIEGLSDLANVVE